MISYGSQLSTLKRQTIQYILEKVREPGYKNDPDLLRVCQSGAVMAVLNLGNLQKDVRKLEECSIERLCNIADKIHFKPVYEPVKPVLPHEEKKETITTQTETMPFEIKQNIPLPGVIMDKAQVVPVAKKRWKKTNYRELPLKDMKIGECIIIFDDCNEHTISGKLANAKSGVERFVSLMDTKKKFKVAKTDDFKIGVWRID